MKIYLATTNLLDLSHFYEYASEAEQEQFRVLFSYHYIQTNSLEEQLSRYFPHPYPELFLDSGAYSAMTKGAPLSVKAYGTWLKDNQEHISLYANLDIIRNAEKTWENQRILEEEFGLSPLPVFHVSEDWKYLERYLEKYQYIALGVAGTRYHQYFPWLVKCFQIAGKRAVFHGFGITTWNVLTAFPWKSADSTSWCSGFQYGIVVIFDEQQGVFKRIRLGDKNWGVYAPAIRRLGFDPGDFSNLTRNTRKLNCAISLISFVRAQKWLERRWQIHA